ncbi:MFS transporter [Bacillus horti]|uniref:MFS family permease n=1 Tax=Caldalkalibacillus horti TaxID=77523 RepID=A0ABT9W5E2_9BACI|nr:MFS transporter [Bacillus horti]MDQ0168460.1 MFS family permease [Bacillus horti]
MGIFKNRNFSLMFVGRLVSNIGGSLYAVAAMLLIYDLGGSTFYTGLAGFLSILPRIVEFCSGPLIDRIPIRSLLIRTQMIQSVLLLIIPLAAMFNFLSVALVLIITPIISTFNVLIYPAQMAALPKVLPEKDLTKGNSLFTIAYQGVDISFNGIAGILFVMIGPFALYLANSAAFLVGAILFSFIRLTQKSDSSSEKKSLSTDSSTVEAVTKQKRNMKESLDRYIHDLKEGVSVIVGSFFAKILAGVIILNFVSAATFAVFPEFGLEIGGTEYVGFLLVASAVGSLAGALIAPVLKLERFPLGKMYTVGYLFAGTCWALAAWAPTGWMTLVLYAIAWIPAGALNIVILTALQKIVPKHLMGRVFTAATSLSGIAAPIGHLFGGSLGVWTGSIFIVTLCGSIVILVALYWLVDPECRNLPATENMSEDDLPMNRLPVGQQVTT